MRIQPHLTMIVLASAGLAAGTGYFLESIPKRLNSNDPEWLAIGKSWCGAFAGQIGLFLAVVGPVAVHALSGRWSWSVRIHTAVSAYYGLLMGQLVLNSYEDVAKPSGHPGSVPGFLEAAMIMVSILVFYLLFTLVTLTWIATRGRRFSFAQPRNSTKARSEGGR